MIVGDGAQRAADARLLEEDAERRDHERGDDRRGDVELLQRDRRRRGSCRSMAPDGR